MPVRTKRQQSGTPTAATAFFSTPPIDMASKLAGITAPVLVIAGAQDAVTGVEPVLALAGMFRSGSSVVIDGAGHYPWVEQPSDFRGAVDPFCTVAVATGTADRPYKGAGSRGGGVTR